MISQRATLCTGITSYVYYLVYQHNPLCGSPLMCPYCHILVGLWLQDDLLVAMLVGSPVLIVNDFSSANVVNNDFKGKAWGIDSLLVLDLRSLCSHHIAIYLGTDTTGAAKSLYCTFSTTPAFHSF